MAKGAERTVRRSAAQAIVLALLGGCSGGKGMADDRTLRLGELSSAISHTPIYVALRRGYFRQAGIDVTIQQLSGGTPSAMAALSTGSVNVMFAGATEFIDYAAKGVIKGKIFAECSDATFDVVAAKGITTFAQLKGKTIGISAPNGADHVYFKALLRHYGMRESDVVFLNSGGPANRLTALAAGAVQAIAPSNANREQSNQIGNVLIKADESPLKFPAGLLFADRSLIDGDRDRLKRLVGALAASTDWIRAHPDDAAADCASSTQFTQADCRKGIVALLDRRLNSRYTWSASYAVNLDGVRGALASQAASDADVAKIKLTDLVDEGIAGNL